jgi:hypothetical protein
MRTLKDQKDHGAHGPQPISSLWTNPALGAGCSAASQSSDFRVKNRQHITDLFPCSMYSMTVTRAIWKNKASKSDTVGSGLSTEMLN